MRKQARAQESGFSCLKKGGFDFTLFLGPQPAELRTHFLPVAGPHHHATLMANQHSSHFNYHAIPRARQRDRDHPDLLLDFPPVQPYQVRIVPDHTYWVVLQNEPIRHQDGALRFWGAWQNEHNLPSRQSSASAALSSTAPELL